jgi:hypothetical protein
MQVSSGSKRSFEEIDDPSPADLAQMSRSERKRHREKKRRNKVNAGFDDLKALLVRIDPEMNDSEELNRVDLIARAVAVMKQLFEENESIKRQLHERGGDQVTLAVPYMIARGPPPDMHHYPHHPYPNHPHYYGGNFPH